MAKGFTCLHCQNFVQESPYMGTSNRNHCNFCLWSKHVDLKRSGDRKAICQGLMEPVGLTFKFEGVDKYGKPRQGELMIIHRCLSCEKISINRIAADDEPKEILNLFERSINLPENIRKEVEAQGVKLLTEADREEVETQLFGRKQ